MTTLENVLGQVRWIVGLRRGFADIGTVILRDRPRGRDRVVLAEVSDPGLVVALDEADARIADAETALAAAREARATLIAKITG